MLWLKVKLKMMDRFDDGSLCEHTLNVDKAKKRSTRHRKFAETTCQYFQKNTIYSNLNLIFVKQATALYFNYKLQLF